MSIKKAYNSWAAQYDTNQNKTRDLDKLATIKTLSSYNFNTVLELGCGTGKNTEWLLTKANKIIGFDFSEKMLAKAIEKINNPKVIFKQADLNLNWDIINNSIDLITSSLTLEHISDLKHIFEQAHLKLHKKGLFFICELHPFKQYIGSKARFETNNGIEELEVYTHNVSEYLEIAINKKFKLIQINEWFDDESKKEIPRLISFIFQKK